MPLDSEKSKAVEARLPRDLQPVYRQIIQQYEFLTHVRFGKGHVAYEVLAEMVLAGWRPRDDVYPSSKLAAKHGEGAP